MPDAKAFADALLGLLKDPGTGSGYRPMVRNPDNTASTERTITVTDPRLTNFAMPTNIPQMVNGQMPGYDAAVQAALMGAALQGVSPQSFPDIESAVAAARLRSSAKDPLVDVFMNPTDYLTGQR